MKKILLITSLLIVFGVGCSNDKITELENRIAELEMDNLCESSLDYPSQTMHRFLSLRMKDRAQESYCRARKNYFLSKNDYEYEYFKKLPDDFFNAARKERLSDIEIRNKVFDSIYKEFYIEK